MCSSAARRALGALGFFGLLAGAGALESTAAAAGHELVPVPPSSLEIRNGAAVLARIEVKMPSLRRGNPRLRELEIDGHPIAEVRIPVRGGPAEEVWVGDMEATPAKTIWSGVTGPRDADGEVTVRVEVSETRILEYQTAAQITRCDAEPPRLFPRAWDFDSGRFRPVISDLPPAAPQKLIARRGDPAMPAGRPIGGFHWIGASTTAAAGSDARGLTSPLALNDGNPATIWAEGLGGDGRGEFLTARAAAGGYGVRGLRIIPGDASSAAAFRAKNRVRRFQIALGPGADQRFDVEIPNDPAADGAHFAQPYWVALPAPVTASCVTLIITDVARGSDAAPPRNFGTTAISDIDIFTELDGPAGADRLVSDIAQGVDCEQRIPLLVSLGEPALLPTAQTILTTKGMGRECLVEALTGLSPAPSSAIVTDALVGALPGATEKEERMVSSTLQRAADPPIRALDEMLSGKSPGGKTVDPADRARAARVLGALPREDAAVALVGAAGRGPDPLRLEVVKALGSSPAVEPPALLAALGDADGQQGPRYADLLRALVPVVKRKPEHLPATLTMLRTALAPSRPFETRARAVMAVGDLGAADGVADLAALRDGSDDPVLRYLAVRELVSLGGPRGVKALRDALADRDPRVRETAALGIGKQEDRAFGQALIDGAKQEPWPFVRRAELEALGHLCVAGTGDLMIRAVDRDVDQVRRAALVSLVRCHDPRSKGILLRTLGRHNEAATLREMAAALLGELGDTSASPDLAAALHRLVNQSEGDIALEGVAASALRALAHLGGPAAVSSAVALAQDAKHPFRSTAIEALGTLCDPGAGAATLRKIVAGTDPVAAVAAQVAQHHCSAK